MVRKRGRKGVKCPICNRDEATAMWEHYTCYECYDKARRGEPIFKDNGTVVVYLRGFYTLDNLMDLVVCLRGEKHEGDKSK